jgi:phosphoglycerate dehydrogenase-like enzyme
MRVLGVRRSAKQPGDPVDEMHTIAEFPKLLPRCNWVVLACPLTDETRNLLNTKTLSMLPQGAQVINVARGGVADEPALIESLKSRHLGGAYLDVFENEPLPLESPLWDMPNVICTPHRASASSGNEKRAAEVFTTNFVRWGRGDLMLNERNA